MMNHLFTNLVESGILGQIGDETMHLSEDFDILHHILSICFQTTIEVMQILNSAHLSGRCIESLVGRVFDMGS